MAKYIIITGATGGIGSATAKLLSSESQNLLLVDLTDTQELVEDLRSANPNVQIEGISLDISKPSEFNKLSSYISSKSIVMSGLVHLAGITMDRSIKKMEFEEWEKVISVNLTGTYNCLKFSQQNIANGGSIIVTGSTSAHYGNFGQINYVASKGGVEAMTKTAAREFAKSNVRVNCLVPGFIDTKMTGKLTEEQINYVVGEIPLKRMGQPIDLAYLISFLLSEKSNYITGTSIKIDGGLRI